MGCAVAAPHRLLIHNLFSGTILIHSQLLLEQVQGDTGQFSDQRCTGVIRNNLSVNSEVSHNCLQWKVSREEGWAVAAIQPGQMPCRLSVQSEPAADLIEHQVSKEHSAVKIVTQPHPANYKGESCNCLTSAALQLS